jgi:UDP-N-acetylmuramoyl-tripeptide--D-alanyl-D-alanine ligase
MRELGEQTLNAHREVGEYAAKAGLPVLLGVGEECSELVAAYREAGGASASLFNDHEALAEECLKRVGAESVILVKGSRGARMDKIVAALTPEPS